MKLENYFHRFGIRNGSGAESSVSAVHIYIIAGLLIVYVPNIIAGAGKIGDTKRHENRRPPIRQSPAPRIPHGTFQLANVSLRPAYQILRKTQDAGKRHGSRCRIKCPLL